MSTTETIDIEKLLQWSEPKRVMTGQGERILRKAPPTEEFSKLFGSSKAPGPAQQQLKAAGIGWGKDQRTGAWEIIWWQPIPAAEIARQQETIEASKATDAAIEIPVPKGLAYLGYQKGGINFALRAYRNGYEGALIADEMGLGKAQPIDAKILTPTGWKMMGQINLGDFVIGADGKKTRVIGVFPQGEKNCYRVTFSDGATTECCDEHLWEVCTAHDRWAKGFSTVKTLGEIRESLHRENGNSVHFIPMVKKVEFEVDEKLPLHPYVLGALIGDGGTSTHQVRFASVDMPIIERMAALLPHGLSLKKVAKSACDYNITKTIPGAQPNLVSMAITELGLRCRAEDKFIPQPYLLANIESRIEMLRGLCDTDGSVRPDGTVEFTTVSSELAENVRFIVGSLGGSSRLSVKSTFYKNRAGKKIQGQPAFRLIIAMPDDMNPFWLPRKAEVWKPREKYPPSRAFKSVELIGRKLMQCIKVDAPDHLYVTDDFIVTHNTIQAIGLINADQKIARILVVCPNSLKINWSRELSKWLTRKMTIGIATGQCFPSSDVVIINYDILQKWEQKLSYYWDLVIVDECHYIKNPKTIRGQAIMGTKANRKTGAPAKSGIPARRRLALTGTPIVNRPIELFPIINWLAPKDWPNFFTYAKRYANAHNNGFGWDFTGAAHLDELQTKLRGSIMVRRKKAEVLTELPPKRRQVIELPANGCSLLISEQNRQHEEREKTMQTLRAAVELAKVSDSEAQYADAIQALAKARQVAFDQGSKIAHEIALAKVPYTIEHVRQALEEGKVILFCHHLDVISMFKKEFPQAAVVTGEVSIQDRQAAVDRFQTDAKCDLFIGGIHAAGVGLTLTASSHVVFHEIDWVPGNMSQAEDRAHRIGQKDSVLVQLLVLEGSLDSRKAQVLVQKQDVIDRALDRTVQVGKVERGDVVIKTVTFERSDDPVEIVKNVTVTKEEVTKEAPTITKDQVAAIHQALRILAGVCDGAHKRDDSGFNGADAEIGHSLANQGWLSQKQAVLGRKLIRKYHRQLGTEILERAGCPLKKQEAA
jgi:hypothetical protein